MATEHVRNGQTIEAGRVSITLKLTAQAKETSLCGQTDPTSAAIETTEDRHASVIKTSSTTSHFTYCANQKHFTLSLKLSTKRLKSRGLYDPLPLYPFKIHPVYYTRPLNSGILSPQAVGYPCKQANGWGGTQDDGLVRRRHPCPGGPMVR